MKVVIAPDKFKATLTATEACEAIAMGVRAALPQAEIATFPMSDGGEGFAEVLATTLGGRSFSLRVTDPTGDPIEARYFALDDGRFALDTASASGLQVMASPDPLGATSRGTGELLGAVLERDPGAAILCGLGGSGYNDGGTGAAAALGWRFLDEAGDPLAPGGGSLASLARIERPDPDPCAGAEIIGAYDVDNLLLGPAGAARVFGPQKGASPEQVETLEQGLATLARRIEVDVGVEVAHRTASGASGGMGAAVLAFLGGTLSPGFDLIAAAVRLQEEIATADLVVTGEGKLDESSFGGKTPDGVARLAADAGVRCVIFAGEVEVEGSTLRDHHIADAISLVSLAGDRALDAPADVLTEAVRSYLDT